jgi:dienelactone hydrolase
MPARIAGNRKRPARPISLALLSIGAWQALAWPAPLQAQNLQDPNIAREMIEGPRRAIARSGVPDSRGDGPYPATKRQIDGPPGFVAYYPADLPALGKHKLPLYIFGNGACSEDGASARHHLLEIASHGYLAVALGGVFSGPGITVTAESLRQHNSKTRSAGLGQAIDWAVAENKRADSPFFGRLDTKRIALSGYSCGGIQALKYAGDPRVTTFVIMNSGILDKPMPQVSEMTADKSLLDKISVPILYVLGGPRDIAYPNGMDDFRRLPRVPAAVINTDVTHAGTYDEPNGGRAALAVLAWLDWRLRGDRNAAKWFEGPDCKICKDPAWSIERRNIR